MYQSAAQSSDRYVLDVLFCVETTEFQLLFWRWASGLYFGRELVLKAVKLCQSWSQALHVCHAATFFCVWVNCGSGGIPATPQTCIHTAFSVYLSPSLFLFLFLAPTNSRSHTNLLYTSSSWLLYPLVWRCCHCCSASETSRTSPRACQKLKSRSFGASLFLKHLCVTASHAQKIITLSDFMSSVFLLWMKQEIVNKVLLPAMCFLSDWAFDTFRFWVKTLLLKAFLRPLSTHRLMILTVQHYLLAY